MNKVRYFHPFHIHNHTDQAVYVDEMDHTVEPTDSIACTGATMREHYAGLAMAAIVSTVPHLCAVNPRYVAAEAVSFADALIAELDK